MKKINTCFILGTIGIICTAILQMISILYTNASGIQYIFYAFYAFSLTMLLIGYRKIVNEKNLP